MAPGAARAARGGTRPRSRDGCCAGAFPEPALDPRVDPALWLSSYIQTYLERDVRSLRAVGELGDFQRALYALAARSGG